MFEYVGLYLSRPVYSHGQLYVGLSRAVLRFYFYAHVLRLGVKKIPHEFK